MRLQCLGKETVSARGCTLRVEYAVQIITRKTIAGCTMLAPTAIQPSARI